jgi:hypothetical protein
MANLINTTIGSFVVIPVKVVASTEVDWSSFTFVPAPNQTIQGGCGGKIVITPFGEATFLDEKITYTLNVNNPTCYADILQFKVADASGTFSKITTATITFNTIPAPVAQNIEVCSTCYQQTPYFELMDYATGDITNYTILTQPTSGTLLQTGNSVAYIQNLTDNSATDSFTYKVTNKNGIDSNTATVSINRRCLGNFTNTTVDITCTPKIFDLSTLISNATYINSGTWSEVTTSYTSQGGTITGANGTVNFTSITPGTYSFKSSASLASSGLIPNVINCPQTLEITVNIVHTLAPAITYTGNTLISTGNYVVNFTVSNVPFANTITVTNNGNPVNVFIVNPALSGNNGYFALQLPQGTNVLSISAVTKCNTTVTTTASIVVP